jgi:hypothetical protein
MTMIATGIPLRHLHLVWSDLWPLLEPAVKRSPDKPDACPDPGEWVLARLLAGDAQLWAVYDANAPVAAIVTQIQTGIPPTELPSTMLGTGPRLSTAAEAGEKRCLIWLVGGSRLRDWAADFIFKLEDWARSLGCVTLRGVGRPGWARIVKKFGGVSVDAVDGLPTWERRIA